MTSSSSFLLLVFCFSVVVAAEGWSFEGRELMGICQIVRSKAGFIVGLAHGNGWAWNGIALVKYETFFSLKILHLIANG